MSKRTKSLLKHLALFHSAADNIARHRLRSVAIVLCLVAILSPFLSAIAVLEGVKAQSLLSVDEGADIYVTMDLFGRNGVIPLGAVEEIKALDGVVDAVPRAICRIFISGRPAVLLGIPFDRRISNEISFGQGSPPRAGEVAIGTKLAQALQLGIGDEISIGARAVGIINHTPYIMKKMYRIAGTFTTSADIRTADLVMMDIQEAVSAYEMDGFATDIAIYVKPDHTAQVSEDLMKMNSSYRIQTKDLVRTYVERGLNTRGGVFTSLYVVAFAVAIPTILVMTGIGLPEKRKEVGVLKATGWQTHEVMAMVVYENLLYAVLGASAALVVSFIWVRLLNGFFIARLFISGINDVAAFPIPSIFLPLPFFLAFVLALLVTMVGSIITTWRSAVVPPAEALR
jgi:ABC-type lipoprotein release transport system permease subunit